MLTSVGRSLKINMFYLLDVRAVVCKIETGTWGNLYGKGRSWSPIQICAGRAAKLLDISRWDLSDLMSEVGISPFAEVTAEELADEVETALKALNNQDDEGRHE